jgi:hypothetical protein
MVAMLALSVALGLGGTGAVFVPMFSVMTRMRASHDAANIIREKEAHLHGTRIPASRLSPAAA